MKKLFLIVMLIVGCSSSKERVATLKAQDGVDGNAGQNGYSIVSLYREASQCECEFSGEALDMFLDLDYSFTASEGDVYTNSLVTCNGRNGLDGADGANGQDGINGIDGEDGAIGPQGETGEQGPSGPQGEEGPQGLQGPAGSSGAVIVAYSGSSCQKLGTLSVYVKANGSNYKLYTSSSCHSSSAFAEVSQGESYWVSGNALAVWYSNALRVITFN